MRVRVLRCGNSSARVERRYSEDSAYKSQLVWCRTQAVLIRLEDTHYCSVGSLRSICSSTVRSGGVTRQTRR
jgi:hypothetical protein